MMSNVQRGTKQLLNLPITPFSWIQMEVTKTGTFDFMNINSPTGALRGFQVNSDTTLYARVLGNREIGVYTFKYKNFEPTLFNYSIQTIGEDTVVLNISF